MPKKPPPKRPGARPAPARPGDLIDLTLTDIAHGGAAIGRAAGRPVFVPYAIPGERLQARITRAEGSVYHAQGVTLLEASADRVTPVCAHFGPGHCRNCQWQHIAYTAQPLLKQDILADQLSRLGGFSDAILERAMQPTLAAPQPWGYAERVTLERDVAGQLGYWRTDGRSIEPLTVCHILHPELQALYEALDLDFATARRVHLARGSAGAAMLMLELTSEDLPELAADFPVSVNVLLPDNAPVNLVGDTALHYEIGGRRLRVTAGSAFRAYLSQFEALIGSLLTSLQPLAGQRVLDLYAGVGSLSAFLAPRAAHVTLIESYPPAVSDASVNLAAFANVTLIEGTVEATLPTLRANQPAFDVVVMDPPSSGLSPAALQALVALDCARLVYLSSSPATLARDAKALAQQGYALRRVQPIDSAPQTYYVDSLSLFERTHLRRETVNPAAPQ